MGLQSCTFVPDKFICYKKFEKKLAYIYYMINASCEGICVEFERKTTQHWFFLLSNCQQVQTNSFMTDIY